MNDWQPGDYALCICDDWGRGPSVSLPKRGSIYTVREVDTDPFGNVGFWLEEFPGFEYSDGFAEHQFIKVTPPEDMVTEERELELA